MFVSLVPTLNLAFLTSKFVILAMKCNREATLGTKTHTAH